MSSIIITVAITLLAVAAIVALIYFAKRSDVVKIIAILVIYAGLIGGGFYSLTQINSYYGAEGGIIGQLFPTQTNKVAVTETDLTISNIEMLAQGDSKDTYIARINLNDEFAITPNACYLIEVNGMPCTYSMNGDAGATVTFSYLFTKENNQKVLDNLTINLTLEKNYNMVTLSIQNGTQTVGLWQEFFNRKGCTIHIEQIDSSEFLEKTNNIDTLKKVSLVAEDVTLKNIYVLKGSTYTLPTEITINEYRALDYWYIDENRTPITEIVVTEDIIVKASINYTTKLNGAKTLYSDTDIKLQVNNEGAYITTLDNYIKSKITNQNCSNIGTHKHTIVGDTESIFFTGTQNNGLWRFDKSSKTLECLNNKYTTLDGWIKLPDGNYIIYSNDENATEIVSGDPGMLVYNVTTKTITSELSTSDYGCGPSSILWTFSQNNVLITGPGKRGVFFYNQSNKTLTEKLSTYGFSVATDRENNTECVYLKNSWSEVYKFTSDGNIVKV